ncbi:MAG: methyltransferase domain-containing protein [Nitrospinae bacterium]|nr:methyltransferase domain-containing protein [Nitrospinota bacterium]
MHLPTEASLGTWAERTGRRSRHLRRLRRGIETSYDTALQELIYDALTVQLLRVADVDRLLDRLPSVQFRPDERLPYWAELWPSAIALARYLWRAVDVQGLQVLELGCGIGLAGIVASRKGAAVTFTDYEADALAFTRYNVLHNGCTRALIRHLDWFTPTLTETYQLIIASDVLYERTNFQPLLQLYHRNLAPGGHFILAEPNRPVATAFFRLLRDHGFRYQRTSEQVELNGEQHAVSMYHGDRKER